MDQATPYDRTYAQSTTDPEAFWTSNARLIDWIAPPKQAFDGASWFPGGTLNTCFNAVDRHVLAGRGDDAALIYDSPVTRRVQRFSFAELQEHVALLAGLIAAQGVGRGDRVIIFMPMIPEAVFAMLACARLGAVHSVVFGGFAAEELAKRIDNAEPRLILTASCGIEPGRIVPYLPLVRGALDLSRRHDLPVVVLQRTEHPVTLDRANEHDWGDLLASAMPCGCTEVQSSDPLYILYTSGTTGAPKGVVRDNGGHAVALAWSMSAIYGAKPGETFWAASDIGWVVGHSYIVYGPLLHGCATVLFEGKPVGTPDAGAFWRVVRRHAVRTLFTAPTAIRAIRREDPAGMHLEGAELPLRALFLAGERADPPTVAWAQEKLGTPVIDHWWQTELGWPALATCIGLGEAPAPLGAAGRPVPGYDFSLLPGADGCSDIADLCIRLPLPPGCAITLWRNDEGYRNAYLAAHPGWFHTGDAASTDLDGFFHLAGRTDDIINVAGHRLSTSTIESIVASLPEVAECAVIGVPDYLKGEVPLALVTLRADADGGANLIAAKLRAIVRDRLGPVASFKLVTFVAALPKTRSGKILRKALREGAKGTAVDVATIDDPEVLQRCLDAISDRSALSFAGADTDGGS